MGRWALTKTGLGKRCRARRAQSFQFVNSKAIASAHRNINNLDTRGIVVASLTSSCTA
jgi:hypothetical protein